MVNLFDIARQAGQGTGLDTLSRQFGLAPEQTMRTVEALLPAFSLALQRSASHPGAFADVIGAIGSGRYASFFDVSPGRQNAGGQSGDDVLTQLFKSPEATRQVAEQAAAMAGVGVQVVQRMMPVVAATLIGGLFRYASLEGFSDLLRQWSDALKTASSGAAPRSAPPATDPWSAWAEVAASMLGGPSRPATRQPAPTPAHPFEAWTATMAAMLGGSPAVPAPPPPKEPNPFEALSRMFETGQEVQAQHLASLQSILDGVWGSPPRGR